MRVVFFDGYCSLCNGIIDWMMRWDQSKRLTFASLQGETAEKLLSPDLRRNVDTIVYSRDGETLVKSNAVLAALYDMGGIFQVATVFRFIPQAFRDIIYDLVANNRFLIFGKRETCRVPSPEEKQRLLP